MGLQLIHQGLGMTFAFDFYGKHQLRKARVSVFLVDGDDVDIQGSNDLGQVSQHTGAVNHIHFQRGFEVTVGVHAPATQHRAFW